MLPMRCSHPPWRKSDTTTASQICLSGNGTGPRASSRQASLSPRTWVRVISTAVSGRPWVSSHGMAAYS